MRYGLKYVGAQNVYYDGVNLSDYFDITDVGIQVVPTVELASTAIPGKVGNHFDSVDYGERTITFRMSRLGYDRNKIHITQVFREFLPLLVRDRPCPLSIDEHNEIYAVLTGAEDLERMGMRGIVEVTFTAEDPYFYGDTKQVELEAGDNEVYISNPYSVLPTFEVIGATDPLVITNKDTGDRVYISDTVKPESRVIVDAGNERCTINGSYLPVDPQFNDFFTLPPGLTNISLSSGAGVLTYRERIL